MSLSREDFHLAFGFLFLPLGARRSLQSWSTFFCALLDVLECSWQPLTSRAGEQRSAPSGPDARGWVAGKRALALGDARSQGHNWAITQKTNALTWQPCLHVSRAREQGPRPPFDAMWDRCGRYYCHKPWPSEKQFLAMNNSLTQHIARALPRCRHGHIPHRPLSAAASRSP